MLKSLKNERSDYINQTRLYGEGEIRIGTSLNLNLDIFSLGFISQLSDEVLSKHLNILTGEIIEETDSDDSDNSSSDEDNTGINRKKSKNSNEEPDSAYKKELDERVEILSLQK